MQQKCDNGIHFLLGFLDWLSHPQVQWGKVPKQSLGNICNYCMGQLLLSLFVSDKHWPLQEGKGEAVLAAVLPGLS